MNENQVLSGRVLRLGGIAALASGLLFFVGVALQFSSGWFPEEALAAGDMEAWLTAVAGSRTLALAGVGCSIAAIALWAVVGLVLYRMLAPQRPAAALLGAAGYLAGVPLALAAFALGFGATWGLMDAAASADAAVITALMRGFLVSDDIATLLIAGLGNGFFSLAGLRSGLLPRWLGWLGLLAGGLVTVVLLRYVVPFFAVATIGYPLVLLWFVLLGIVLLRR